MRPLYAGQRVVVLGAAGFIGRWVARALTRQEAHLYAVVRDRGTAASVFAAYGVEADTIEADLSQATELRRVLQDLAPTVAFNLVGYGVDPTERDETLAYRLNADLPQALCTTMAELPRGSWQGQAIIHVGSALEYGRESGALAEDGPALPTTLYGQSKYLGTSLVRDGCLRLNVRGLTARLFTVYGPGEPANRLAPTLLAASHSTALIPLTEGGQRRDFTYVEDVAEGLLRLGVAPARCGDVVNLASGALTSVREFVETAAHVLSIAPERLRFGALPTRAEEMSHMPVTTHRLRLLTHWTPSTSIAVGLRKTLDFESGGCS